MTKTRKRDVGDLVRTYRSGALDRKNIFGKSKALDSCFVNFYNLETVEKINVGDEVFVYNSLFTNKSYNSVFQGYLNNKTIVNVKKLSSISGNGFNESVIASRTFVSNSFVNQRDFYDTSKGLSCFRVEFGNVLFPVQNASSSTASANATWFCKPYGEIFINCSYSEATHNIVDASNFSSSETRTINESVYKTSFCCLVRLTKKISIEEGDGVKIEESPGIETSSATETVKDIKISAAEIFTTTTVYSWTQNSARTNPISATHNGAVVSIQSPLSKSGDTIESGKLLVVCKQLNGEYLLINAEC